ncbi:hypothetical protein [Conexibacter woesei]|uniref:hypothetical protein n=1 Tax=Conexibacter woesei TaxID=191495 RepID=UPI0004274AAB|nr:hypothetical protein [Conexibacter woesei]
MTCSLRGPAAIVGACAAAVLMLLVLGAPARAVGLAVCTGSESASFSPAMTLTAQSGRIDYADTLGCTSNDSGAATATTGGSFTGSYGCLDPVTLPGQTGTLTYTWADRTTSVFSYTSVTGDLFAGGSYVFTAVGSMTSGKFAGAAVTLVQADPTLSLVQCLTTGISAVTGDLTLTVTGT